MSTETKIQKYAQPIITRFKRFVTFQTVLGKAMETIESGSSLKGQAQEMIINGLKDIIDAVQVTGEKSIQLSSLLSGIDKSDERMLESHLSIIESGNLVQKYQSSEDLAGVDDVTRRLHRISWLVHCCAAEELYDYRFPLVEKEESQSNKKQKVEE